MDGKVLSFPWDQYVSIWGDFPEKFNKQDVMTDGAERFSPEEKELLAPFVTNTEGSVFALTNLPEVIKGALFSRYSRSTLGLRRLLLKEFILDEAAEFSAIRGASATDTVESAEASYLAVERAQSFYDRILDGYGDDSIGELGGAHLALENVSMIATKVLEDARIGGSPLEKSTRYVSFSEKVNGEFRFYQEPRILASAHGGLYLKTCRSLFQTYTDLFEPLCAYIHQAAPRPREVSEAAHNRSVRARAFDALRGLLPAATQTNMGIFGNGRFFEALILRLAQGGLSELNALSGAMYGELAKVIPSFVRRAHPDNKHFQGFHDHGTGQQDLIQRLAARLPAKAATVQESPQVRLVEHDPNAEEKILAALVFPAGEATMEEARTWAMGLRAEEKAKCFQDLGALRTNRRHKLPRAAEMVSYTFDLVGDFGMYRDLHRHRTLTQERQPLSTRLGYVTPEELEEAGLAGEFRQQMEQAARAFEIIHAEFPSEAQYVVPMAYNIRWMVHINLRALMWMVELRSAPQGHPAYRAMAQQMFRAVEAVHPNLAALIRYVDLEEYPLGRLGAEQRLEEKRHRAKEN